MSIEPLELSLAPASAHSSGDAVGQAARSSRSGPGWFDSSFDLHRGLEVREGWPGDARLRSWIEGFLDRQPDAGRIAERTASPSDTTAIA